MLRILESRRNPVNPQLQSPLFALPVEIRRNIFRYAFTSYPDPSETAQYDQDTCYRRPGHFSPLRTDTDLMRTCRAAFIETWGMSLLHSEQVLWLAWPERAPPHADYNKQLSAFNKMATTFGVSAAAIDHLQVFAQMYNFDGREFTDVIASGIITPRRLTITIRHTDWWKWEDNQCLIFGTSWFDEFFKAIPDATEEICFELETVAQRLDDLKTMTEYMQQYWYFKKNNGQILMADKSVENKVTRWKGSSTWEDRRWERDECEPGKIEYVVMKAIFRPYDGILEKGGTVHDDALENAFDKDLNTEDLSLQVGDYLDVGEDDEAGSDEAHEGYEGEEGDGDDGDNASVESGEDEDDASMHSES